MALPTGLVPVLVAVSTVGVSLPVAVGALSWHRVGPAPLRTALRPAFATVALCYLVGAGVVVAVAGAASVPVSAVLLGSGVVAFLLFGALPLGVGRRVVARATGVSGDEALRYAVLGWPVAMALVSAVFVAPSVLGDGGVHLLHVDGAVAFGAMLTVDLLVAVFGAGAVGVGLARVDVTSNA
jgi:hypothetical protein